MTPRFAQTSGGGAERGLTLLELLVALAIFAVIGAVLMPVISRALSTRAAATERIGIDAEARMILDRLEQDVAANVDAGFTGASPPPRFFAPASRSRDPGTSRVLLETTTLVARGVTPADAFVGGEDIAALSVDRGDQAHVLWSIDSDGRLLRQEVRPPGLLAVDWARVPVEVLSERAGLTMEFYQPDSWLDTWDSTDAGAQRGRAPVAVRTTLRVGEGNGALELVSTVVLPVVETSTDLQRTPGVRH